MGTKVIIGDDHRMFRDGLRALLEKEADIEIVGEAGDGRTVVNISNELLPDVVLMDISMPDLSGIEATRQITRDNPQIKVIALSMYADRRFIYAVMKAGASGYLIKDCAYEEVVQAIRTVIVGHVHFGPCILDIIAKDYVDQVQDCGLSVYTILTEKEREILQLIAEGNGVRDIAAKLNLSSKTIETHRQKIMSKLKITNVAGLTKYAISEGLTSL